jgi:hypothetical protein
MGIRLLVCTSLRVSLCWIPGSLVASMRKYNQLYGIEVVSRANRRSTDIRFEFDATWRATVDLLKAGGQ